MNHFEQVFEDFAFCSRHGPGSAHFLASFFKGFIGDNIAATAVAVGYHKSMFIGRSFLKGRTYFIHYFSANPDEDDRAYFQGGQANVKIVAGLIFLGAMRFPSFLSRQSKDAL